MPQGGVAIKGGELRRARLRKGWSLRDVAAATKQLGAEVDFGNVSRYERGSVKPHPRTLKMLADALGITVDALLADEDAAA